MAREPCGDRAANTHKRQRFLPCIAIRNRRSDVVWLLFPSAIAPVRPRLRPQLPVSALPASACCRLYVLLQLRRRDFVSGCQGASCGASCKFAVLVCAETSSPVSPLPMRKYSVSAYSNFLYTTYVARRRHCSSRPHGLLWALCTVGARVERGRAKTEKEICWEKARRPTSGSLSFMQQVRITVPRRMIMTKK